MSLPQEVLSALTRTLVAHINANKGNDNLSQLQQLLNAVTPPNPPRTPNHIAISDVGTPPGTTSITPTIQRSDSDISTASSSSNSSHRDWSDVADDYAVQRRKRSSEQDRSDNRVVTRPVLTAIDASHLAPHPAVRNSLFRHKFKKQLNFDGTRQLKKNKDIVMPIFKNLIRPILGPLVMRNLAQEQRNDPTMTYEQLRRRYFFAALRVTKKRRANHIQSWRPDKNGTHLPLIYSSDAVLPVIVAPAPPAPAPHAVTPVPAPTSVAPPAPPTTVIPAAVVPAPPAVVTPAPSSVVTPAAAQAPSTLNPPVDFPHICADCGNNVSDADRYPKGDLWGTDPKIWCQSCWSKQSQDMVDKEIEDPDKKRKAIQPLDRDQDQPAQKRNRLTKCKWYNSTKHKTR